MTAGTRRLVTSARTVGTVALMFAAASVIMTMTTDRAPTRRHKHKTVRPAAGAGRASTSVYQTSSGWLIMHRGESLPGYGTVGHDGPALLDALTRISREITAIEMRVSDQRARRRGAAAARRPRAAVRTRRAARAAVDGCRGLGGRPTACHATSFTTTKGADSDDRRRRRLGV